MTALNTDFDMMRTIAATTQARNDEIRSLLTGFIARMQSVPPSVWGGLAAARFRDVVAQWNTESTRLSEALTAIAETVRHSEQTLRQAAYQHAARIGDVTAEL
ncbi:WXG100 family type VII secretion target [Mycobacterium sp. M26]|uniref:WXG100 family type VII secretion target n=1 Tax=Mycobacterium sp. M26 TaxID=1762962 RepID=UPI000B322D18|nr:WXG100 family type VII secretion target [Mycobacterium sp. M26]